MVVGWFTEIYKMYIYSACTPKNPRIFIQLYVPFSYLV